MSLSPTRATSKHHSHSSLSVLMAVYNGEHSLDNTLSSVFRQSFQDFVVVVVNDASTDNSHTVLEKWQVRFGRNRFTIIQNEHNLGLTKSLNLGLAKCNSKYIARIDADDVWLSNKLQLQVDFLDQNPAVGIIGCWYINVGENSRRNFDLPTTNSAIKRNIYRINPFGHSCVVIRKKLLDKNGGYDSKIRYSQDRDLWFRLMNQTRFCNLPFYLCQRQTVNSISSMKFRQQMWQSLKIRFHYAKKYQAPLYTYLFLIIPLLIILKPRFFSARQVREQSLTTVNFNDFKDLHKHHLLFINDRPLAPHRAETVARYAMAKAFASHKHIGQVFISNISPLQAMYVRLAKKYHVVYLRCGSIAAAIVSLRLFFTSQILILEVHNLDSKTINYIASHLYRIAAKRMDLLITIDPLSNTTWVNYGASPSNIIELPSATLSHNKIRCASRTDLLNGFSLPLDKKIIVYAGNLYRDRGIENIIQSSYSLRGEPFVFVIVGGSKEDVMYYRNYIKTNYNRLNDVYFLGYIPHPQVMSLLSVANLILVTYSKLCPTVTTMSPIKLMEALATGNPVLATGLPRIRTLAQNYNITYHTPDNTQDLTANILKILSKPVSKQEKRQLLSFTWEDRTKKILSHVLL